MKDTERLLIDLLNSRIQDPDNEVYTVEMARYDAYRAATDRMGPERMERLRYDLQSMVTGYRVKSIRIGDYSQQGLYGQESIVESDIVRILKYWGFESRDSKDFYGQIEVSGW